MLFAGACTTVEHLHGHNKEMDVYGSCDPFSTASNTPRRLGPTKSRGYNFSFTIAPGLARHPEFIDQVQDLDVANNARFPLVFKAESGYFLHFPGTATFLVASNLHEILCDPTQAASTDTIQHLLFDQVLPRVLNQSGDIVLHAGAVVDADGAIAFLGESGSGKSTLCASFCREGFPLLTDDYLVIKKEENRILGLPGYPSLRLWPDMREALGWESSVTVPMAQYSTKERLEAVGGSFTFCDQPVPLRLILVLNSRAESVTGDQIAIRPMRPREAMMSLIASSFRLDLNDAVVNEKAFRNCSLLSTQIPHFELSYPRSVAYLPEIRSAILNHLANDR